MALASFSKAKAFLLLLAAAILCLSVSVLALSARGIRYYLDSTTGGNWAYVKIEAYIFNQTTQNTTEHITRLSYQPGTGLGMGDMYAPLMGGILGTLLASIILFASVWTGDTRVNISLTGKTVRPIKLLGSSTVLALDALLLLIFVAVAGYTWGQDTQSSKSLDLDQIPDPGSHFSWYNANDFTFERWNCALAMSAVNDPKTKDPDSSELYGLCREARVARELMMALFLLALARLCTHFWAWRRHNIAVRLGKAEGYAEQHAKAKRAMVDGSRHSSNGLSGHGDAVELPAYRFSMVEAPGASVEEMQGEDGSKEMASETVAVEMEGSARGKT